jgi:hypothetical protein
MNSLYYDAFYRQYGISRFNHLFTRQFPIADFHFPRNALYHHVSHDAADDGPDENLPYFKELENKIPTDHYGRLESEFGNPRRASEVQLPTLIRKFHHRSRHFKYWRKPFKTLKDPNLLEVINYGFLQKLFKYSSGPLTPYFAWLNVEKSAWTEIQEACKTSDRQNFRFIQLPEVLPSLQSLNTYSRVTNSGLLRAYPTSGHLALLDLWKWLGEDTRAESLLATFQQSDLAKINLVFLAHNRWSVINLAHLDSWRKIKAPAKAGYELKNHEDLELPPGQLQKVFLRFAMQLQSTGVIPEDPKVSQQEPSESTSDSQEPEAVDLPSEEEADLDPNAEEATPEPPSIPSQALEPLPGESSADALQRVLTPLSSSDPAASVTSEEDPGDGVGFIDRLDEDLSILEDLEKIALVNQDSDSTPTPSKPDYDEVRAKIYTEIQVEDQVKADIEAIAGYNFISASDYRNQLQQLEKFNQFQNPFDPQHAVKDFIQIKPEELAISEEAIQLTDSATVFDKSMVKSTLKVFDNAYISKVMPKDILGSVVAIQRAGILIKDYQIEPDVSALGEYEVHYIKLHPIEGVPSEIRFRIPKVNEEGEFTTNGNKYRMRKQRGDLPIRKINPSQVALSSYYGKVFVNRSDKKKHDPDYWLYNRLLTLSLNKASGVTIAPANVFDNYFQAPKIYSGLGKYFKTINLKDLTLVFDHKERLGLFEKSLIKRLENHNTRNRLPRFRVVGKTAANVPVLVDYNDEFYLYQAPPYQETGTAIFTRNDVMYDVNRLLQLTAGTPLQTFKVDDLKWILEHSTPDEDNEPRVQSADLSAPILVTLINDKPHVVDGLHRLQKALQTGTPELPGRLITPGQMAAAQLASEADALQGTEAPESGWVKTGDTYTSAYFHRLGTIYQLLGIPLQEVPLSFSTVSVFSEKLAVGLVLGYLIGFDNLLTLLGVTPEIKETGDPIVLKDHEWTIAFKDKTLIFTRDNRLATLVLAGFNEYKTSLKKYVYDSFNAKNVYLNVLLGSEIGVRYLKEINLLDRLFVDPITRDILEALHEPVTFRGLLVRGSEMLLLDNHPDSQDMAFMRIKGYERVAGAVYRQLVLAVREFNARNIRGKSKVELHPYAVWNLITQDPAVKLVEDINPIQNLKEQEAVTYVGEGGRAKDAMNKPSRAYHENDVGTISEATVDSGDVGINTYLSANPKFSSLRGLTERFDFARDGGTSLLSTSALCAPGAIHDDPKRVNFISIQQGHTVPCVGYHQPILRTGYEELVPERVGKQFAYLAEGPGKVISQTPQGIIVEYASGERVGVDLGRTYGRAEGTVYPHDIVSPLNLNDPVQKGDVVAYHAGFFEPDMLNPKRIVMKAQMSVKTVLWESTQTHEDSSAISLRLSQELTTSITTVRSIVIGFKEGVKNLLAPGTKVRPNDILFVIENELTEGAGMFTDEALSTLKRLSAKAPKAKVKGVIDRYEVYYHGALEDMSESLRELTLRSDKALATQRKATGKPVITGAVSEEYRVGGTPLAIDTLELKVYLTKSAGAGVGDKGVFANQMKSVFGEVMDYSLTTASGETVDAAFAQRSFDKRVVLSPEIIGTTTTLLKLMGTQAAKIYHS